MSYKSDIFVEIHYYAGGIKFEYVGGTELRPDWAPDPGTVGFRDEFELSRGDYAVEWRRIVFKNERMTWFGLFFKSVDLNFGDRGNHAGIGIWIKGHVGFKANSFVQSLKSLAERWEKLGHDVFLDAEIKSHIQDFVSNWLPDRIFQLPDLPANIGGLSYSQGSIPETLQLRTPLSKDGLSSACNKIDQLFILPPSDVKMSRVLIHLCAELPEADNSTPTIEIDSTWIPQILFALNSELFVSAARVSELDGKISQFEQDLLIHVGEKNSLALVNTDLSKQIDDFRRQLSFFEDTSDYKVLKKLNLFDNRVLQIYEMCNSINMQFSKIVNQSDSSIDDFTSLMRSMDTRLGILDRKLSLSPPLNNPLNAHPPKQFETEPKRHKDGPQSAENGGILEVLANPQFWLTLIMIVVIGVGSILFMTGRLKFIGLS